MSDSIYHQTIPHTHNDHLLIQNFSELLGFDRESYANSRKFLIDTMKNFLFFGADKALMARKSKSFRNNEFADNNDRDGDDGISKYLHHEEFIDVSKVVNCPSKGYNPFPLNLISFFTIVALRVIGFQINLFTSFLSLPIWLSYSTIMFLLFPYPTLAKIQAHLTKRVLKMWADFQFTITSYIIARIKAKKEVLNLAIRFAWAFLCSISVFFVLFGLLVTGFLLGGLVMNRLVEKPIETTREMNFDYTKASPVAFVPIMSSQHAGVSSGVISREGVENNAGVRAIPYNHKLGITVLLTLPESEYNSKIGVFQVRVEFLSANGKVTASSTHPCMLRYKSHPLRLIETVFKTAPLIAGLQSESQTLAIKISDFTEGYEPTVCLKVALEQRAEYKNGAGIPQIYTASIALESELPQFKKMVWFWRKTVFVWISIVLFLMEVVVVVVLVLLRPVLMPIGKPKGAGAKKGSSSHYGDKISWGKGV